MAGLNLFSIPAGAPFPPRIGVDPTRRSGGSTHDFALAARDAVAGLRRPQPAGGRVTAA